VQPLEISLPLSPKAYPKLNKSLAEGIPAVARTGIEVRVSQEEVDEIQARTDRDGKSDSSWDCKLKDANVVTVATSSNLYQIRKIGS
jgi:hypothetical protein